MLTVSISSERNGLLAVNDLDVALKYFKENLTGPAQKEERDEEHSEIISSPVTRRRRCMIRED